MDTKNKHIKEIIEKNYNNKLNIRFEEILLQEEQFYDFTNIIKKIYNKKKLTDADLNKLFFLFLFSTITILFIYEIYNFLYLE
tara:strand:+ start:3543 stop:3791 length:249 start_codon:yes stop_codon:yes gene_type:complete